MQLRETSSSIHRNLLIDDDTSNDHTMSNGGDEAAQQIAFADRIILNKVDLLEDATNEALKEEKVQNVIQQIRAINGTAPIKQTAYSQIENLDWVLDTNCFDIERAKEIESSFELGEQIFCMPCSSPTMVDKHAHTNSITTIAFIEEGSVNLKLMNTWLASILWPDQDKADSILKSQLEELEGLNQITTPKLVSQRRENEILKEMHIFRIKGILSVRRDENVDDHLDFVCEKSQLDSRKFIVQAVNDLWDINPADSEIWSSEQDRICKLVVIGRNLKSDNLLAGFKECII